jgi:hypothetical protein
MKVPLIDDRKHEAITIIFIGCVFLNFILAGCGEDYISSLDTGSYSCTLTWLEDVPTIETSSRSSRSIDCNAAGVATVAFDFYDGSGTYLIGDEWDCLLHEGTVHGIPAGTDRRLVVTGKDSSGTVLYRGEETGINITASQTTEGGEIIMERIVAPSSPTTVTATTGDGQVTISWDSVSGATSYRLYWATWPGVSETDYEGEIAGITSTFYIHADLTNYVTYYYIITAENIYGESEKSNEVYAMPGPVPSAPTSVSTTAIVSATAADGQVTISWDSVLDATSYNIYWATNPGVTLDTGTKISNVTSPYTHTGLANGTTYYYVVTAENTYGESIESSEVNTDAIYKVLQQKGSYEFAGIYEFENLIFEDGVEVTSSGISQLVIVIHDTLTLGSNAVIRVRNGYYAAAPQHPLETVEIVTGTDYKLYEGTFGKGGNGGSGYPCCGGGGGGGFGGGIGGLGACGSGNGGSNGGDGGLSLVVDPDFCSNRGGGADNVGGKGCYRSGGGGNGGAAGGGGAGGGGGYGGGILILIADSIIYDDENPPKFIVSGQKGGEGTEGGYPLSTCASGENGQGGLLIIESSNYTPSPNNWDLDANTYGEHVYPSTNGGHGIVTGNPYKVLVNGIEQ